MTVDHTLTKERARAAAGALAGAGAGAETSYQGRSVLQMAVRRFRDDKLAAAATLSLGSVILTETALSYLGMGVRPPTPSWGNMLTNAQQYLYRAPFLIVIPGVFIFATVLAANLMGNGLRDALDPRMNG
jgi:ABC-type antimicrobial peptide transport system permease subunit